MHSTILASEPLSKLKFWNLKLHLTQPMMPNVLDFDIRRGAVVVWPKSLALYLGIVNTPCLSVSDEAEKQSDYALGDNSTLVRLWQIIPCTDFTENSASLQPLQCYKRYVVHKEVVWPKSLALYLGIVKSQFQMQQKSSQIMLSQCVCGKLFRAQISPFATITNYCASLQPLQYVVQYIIAVWFPRIFLPHHSPLPTPLPDFSSLDVRGMAHCTVLQVDF